MPIATWNGAVLAEADDDEVEIVEGNVYFPPDRVDKNFLRDSPTRTTCGWKGTASYYDVVVEGEVNKDAAWYYPVTKPAAEHVAGYIAFWKGVTVS
jgi:uncharacterized protein (DUF427 family)